MKTADSNHHPDTEAASECLALPSGASVCSPSFVPYSQAYAVRRLNWGDSIEEVKDLESAEYKGGTKSFLLYEDDLCGQKARIMHTFENGLLNCVMYDVSDTGMDAEGWIEYQLQVKDYLSARYGSPYEDCQMTFNEEDAGNEVTPEKLAAGDAGFTTIWDTDRCYIWMQVVPDDNDELYLSIVFTDPDYLYTSHPDETEE